MRMGGTIFSNLSNEDKETFERISERVAEGLPLYPADSEFILNLIDSGEANNPDEPSNSEGQPSPQDRLIHHLTEVRNLTATVRKTIGNDPKSARVLAELSRSHATSAMAMAVAISGTPLDAIAIDGTGQ